MSVYCTAQSDWFLGTDKCRAKIRDIRLKVAQGFDRRRRETLADDKRLRACRAGTAVGLMATGRTETRQRRRHNAGRGKNRFVFAGC
jgi:hypothetical protein